MFFISKKKFENEVRERVDKALWEADERRYRNDEIREIHNRIGRMEMRLEKCEEKCGIPTNLHSNAVTPIG